MASILFFCVYGYHLLVPGYLIARLLGLRRGRFLLALALSYALLLLNLIPMEWLKAPLWIFTLAFNLQVGFLLIANVIVWWRQWGVRDGIVARRRTGSFFWSSLTQSCWRQRNRWWPPLAIVAGVCVYLAWAGPYLELPADPWQHIVRFLNARQISVASGHFDQFRPYWIQVGPGSLTDFLTRQGCHWYILQALLCRWSGIAISDLPGPLTIANTIMFCLSIYWFALFLWSRPRIHRIQKMQASLWTTCFTALWLGVSVFAYIRYYTFAPTILNYVMYLAVVVLMLDYFYSRSWWSHAVWLAPILLAVMNVIHSQEAVFVFFMGLGMLLVMEGQWAWGWGRRKRRTPGFAGALRPGASNIQLPTPNVESRNTTKSGLTGMRAPAMNMLKIHILFVGGLIIFGFLFYHSLHKPMGGYSDAIVKPIFNSELLHQTWFIQPPAGQFFQVLTWWGVVVYGLFLLYAGLFKRQPFILAGMLMPCLIVFNPLTLAILSRWVTSLNAIYRFNYMIPLPFVAGFMVMRFWGETSKWCKTIRQSGFNSGMSWRGLWAGGCLLGLFVLLTPFEPLLGMKTNSRFYTLKPVPEGNDQRRWGDLIALVRTHPQGQVLTDGYTSTLLQWMDLTATDGDWWIRPSSPGADRLALLRNLDRKQDWWLVVNRRNGEFSTNGYLSGHWPADVLMRFPSFYPEDLILFVKQHPELFKEIWSKDQIQVYDIIESRLWE